jgi:methyl-accepting chemotaxis protein
MSEDTFRWVITGGVAISTLCIIVMTVVAAVLYRVFSGMRARMNGVADRVEPVVDTVRKLADENAPKISGIASQAVEIAVNVKDISEMAKDQAHRFAEVGRDLADRAKAQVARVDACVDDTVEQVHHAGENVRSAVLKPLREASAVLAGIRAAVAAYANGRRPTIDHITQDEEMFI